MERNGLERKKVEKEMDKIVNWKGEDNGNFKNGGR
jgi:hypothetical protein